MQEKIAAILNEMSDHLVPTQMKTLQNVLIHYLSENSMPKEQKDNLEYLHLFLDAKRIEGCSERTISYYRAKAIGFKKKPSTGDVVLKSWDITQKDGDTNQLFAAFDHLIEKEIPYFEQDLQEKLNGGKPAPDFMREGGRERVTLNKYERNPKARAACIAAHGTACAVCGIDFGKAYGPEFVGKIEVHHIVPISEIGEEYVVDPVRDLVPVCPNCHTALHSKKDGVYSIEELKARRKNPM